MACANHKGLCGVGKHRPNKMIAGAELLHKFLFGIDGRIDRPAEFTLRPGEGRQQVGGCHVSNDHQIEIAGGLLFTLGHRAENERTLDLRNQRLQRPGENDIDSHRLADQRRQFRQVGTVRIGTVVNLPPLDPPTQNAGFRQEREFAVEMPGRAVPGVLARSSSSTTPAWEWSSSVVNTRWRMWRKEGALGRFLSHIEEVYSLKE